MLTSLLNSFLVAAAYAPRLRGMDRGEAKATFRARLNRALHSSASRCTFRSWELSEREALRARRVRCEVYEENSGIVGRAVFN